MSKQRAITTVILLFVVWRIMILDFTISASLLLPFTPTYPYANMLHSFYPYPNFLVRMANFDGVHYLTLMRNGYDDTLGIQAFFPVFPLLLRVLSMIPFLDFRVLPLSLFLNSSAFLAACVALYSLLRRSFSHYVTIAALVTLLLFPSSFFFVALYTESLFFLLVILTFLFAGQRRWVLAALCAATAGATRIVGIFLVPALILELLSSEGITLQNWKTIPSVLKKNWQTVLVICSGAIGLLLYMAFLWSKYGDPILFANVQAGFGAGRSTHPVIYPQVVWRAMKILATNTINLRYLTSLQEFLAGTLGLFGILWAGKYVRPSWTLFALASFFFPPLSGTFSSMSRYLLVCFPLFILGGMMYERHPRIMYLLWAMSFLLLAVNTILFIQGYWVA